MSSPIQVLSRSSGRTDGGRDGRDGRDGSSGRPDRGRGGKGGRGSPNYPYGGRRGGNIYTDYDVISWPSYGQFNSPSCGLNYQNDLLNAQFRYSQCTQIANEGSSLISNNQLRQVCQSTLNSDLANAQWNYTVCQNSSYNVNPYLSGIWF